MRKFITGVVAIGVIAAALYLAWARFPRSSPGSVSGSAQLDRSVRAGSQPADPAGQGTIAQVSQQSLEDLAQQLAQGGTAFEAAAKALIGLGTFDSIRTLLVGISKMAPSDATMGVLYSLHDYPDRTIAEWIAKILPGLPDEQSQAEHISLLCTVAGGKATPEALLRLGQVALESQSLAVREVQLAIISQASASDTTQALIQLYQTNDLPTSQLSSVDFAAATALALQGTDEGVSFILRRLAGETDPVAKSFHAEALSKINRPEPVPLLITVAKGQNPALSDTITRGAAMSVLSKADDENVWHALRDLRDDSNGDISYLASEALDRVTARTGFQFE